MDVVVVGAISFAKRLIDVYGSLDEPLFKASDISDAIDYSQGNTWSLVRMCEEDEKLNLPMVVAGQKRRVTFVTETGLYNILSQSNKPIARLWRRVIHDELVKLRKNKGNDVVEQFEEWDQALDDIFIDPETNVMMQSITVQGGDVIQIPYMEDEI